MRRSAKLDRKSFEQFLAAASFLQQLRKEAEQGSATSELGQLLLLLFRLQGDIHSGRLDLESALSQTVSLALSCVGAAFAGIWLFRNTNRFSCCARAGSDCDEERLGAEVLAHLAEFLPYEHYSPEGLEPKFDKRSCYPGCPNSLVVVPVRLNCEVVGGLAAFSQEFDAFQARDVDNLTLLAYICEQALETAVRSGYQEATALERRVIVDVLENFKHQIVRLDEWSYTAVSSDASTRKPSREEESNNDQVETELLLPKVQQAPCLECEHAELLFRNDGKPDSVLLAKLSKDDFGSNTCDVIRKRTSLKNRFTIRRFGAGLAGVESVFASRLFLLGQHCRTSAANLRRYRLSLGFVNIRSLINQLHNSIAFSRSWKVSVRITGLPRFSELSKPQLVFRNLRAALSRRLDREYLISDQATKVWRISLVASYLNAALRYTGDSSTVVAEHVAQFVLTMAHKAGDRLAAVAVSRFNKRRVRDSGSALVVLAIMTSFVLFQTKPSKRISFRSGQHREESDSSASHAPRYLASASMSYQKETYTAVPRSHLEITDRAVANVLHKLTRYEIATLQRTANYGDADADFELGMAYETGYYVRQNCTKAAHWVRVAAEEGSAAAEYNLSLRYRYGDGVAIDYPMAEQWLNKAAAQEYSLPEFVQTTEIHGSTPASTP